MSIEPEFATVDLLARSGCDRRGVDAFALSVIKTERQIRRIFTHIVYQSPSFKLGDIDNLIQCLAENRRVYLEGFFRGIDELSPVPMKEIYSGQLQEDVQNLKEAQTFRNKIFHGQLTGAALGTDQLLDMANQLKGWCAKLAEGSTARLGYDGIGDSYVKSTNPVFQGGLRMTLGSLDDYRGFLKKYMEGTS